ncbi:hypothetical protein QCA50_019579 [Cerrena zonata]|uniref:Uncharacterized protein n=1 Tax=Cerrena zonata TaxID=2478898 RepID=A0AAW0FB07_9APHY
MSAATESSYTGCRAKFRLEDEFSVSLEGVDLEPRGDSGLELKRLSIESPEKLSKVDWEMRKRRKSHRYAVARESIETFTLWLVYTKNQMEQKHEFENLAQMTGTHLDFLKAKRNDLGKDELESSIIPLFVSSPLLKKSVSDNKELGKEIVSVLCKHRSQCKDGYGM